MSRTLKSRGVVSAKVSLIEPVTKLLLTTTDVQLECIPCRIIRQCVPIAAWSSAVFSYHTSLVHLVSGLY